MKKDILVSIVLPFYNGKEFIKETLDSIAAQSYKNFEVIVVDDGSPNKEHSEYLKNAIKDLGDPRFKYFYKDNGGLSDARNLGIKACSGDWVAFIDQDDLWDAGKLEAQLSAASLNPAVEFIFTDGRMIGNVNRDMGVASKNGLEEGVVQDTYTRLLKGNFVICSSVIFKKSILDKVGYSSACFKICPDYEYVIRFAEHTDFYFVDAVLVSYRIHGANTVRNQLKQAADVLSILCDRKLATKKQKILATYNLLRNISALAGSWVRKLAA